MAKMNAAEGKDAEDVHCVVALLEGVAGGCVFECTMQFLTRSQISIWERALEKLCFGVRSGAEICP